jgi:hypothetical protein
MRVGEHGAGPHRRARGHPRTEVGRALGLDSTVMVRLLRRVLRLGLLAGVGVGVLKAVKGRKAPDPWAESWVSTGTPGATRPSPAPVAPAPSKPPASAVTPSRAAKPSRTGPAREAGFVFVRSR